MSMETLFQKEIPKREFGKTKVKMPILALGGAYAVANAERKKEAIELIQAAIEDGWYYLDTAANYGISEDHFGEAIKGKRKEVYLSTKCDKRDYDGAMRELERSLKRLQTDHLDQWIVHHVSTRDDVDKLFAADGAIKAFQKAKEQKTVRFLGVSGHHDPAIIMEMLERFNFDMTLIPTNAVEAHHPRSFFKQCLPLAVKKKVGIAVMKVAGIGRLIAPDRLTAMEAFQYALSQPVHVGVIAIGNKDHLKQWGDAARSFKQMTPEQIKAMEDRTRAFAMDISNVYHNWL